VPIADIHGAKLLINNHVSLYSGVTQSSHS